jgi:hypothetical protein
MRSTLTTGPKFRDHLCEGAALESLALKECVADLTLENSLLKNSMTGSGGYEK